MTHRVAVELHGADPGDGNELLWDDLGAVEDVEVERELLLLRDKLHAELVLRVRAGLDGVRKVATEVVGVLAAELEALVPDKSVLAEVRLPVVLDERTLSVLVDEDVCVLQKESISRQLVIKEREQTHNSETLEHAVRARDGVVGQREERHEDRLGRQGHEVPEIVLRDCDVRE